MSPIADTPLAHRMLEISPAAVAIIDRQNVIRFANQNFSGFFGYPVDELVGQPAERVLPGSRLCDQESRELRRLSQTAGEAHAPASSRIGKNKAGQELAVSYRLHAVSGLPEPLYLLYLDPPERDQLDAAQLEANRLAAIAQMVGGLAHESRNALQRAVACLDLLELDLKNNPDHLQLSNQIRNSLCDLVDSYEEVRRYAQPIQLQRQRLSLLNLCQTAFNELAAEHEAFPHQLHIQPPTDQRDQLDVDRERMRLVFRHLLENAIDASDGAAQIEVDSHTVPSQLGPWLLLQIRDHGSGLPPHAQDRVLEPFFTTKQRGTGLGLAICQRILTAHDGQISLRSLGNGDADDSPPHGRGTCVEIRLPATPAVASHS